MNQMLPHLFAAGRFDSSSKFYGIKESPLRIVEGYELEYYFEEGAMATLNGTRYPMQKDTVLVARPGDRRQSRLPFRCYYLHLGRVTGRIQELLDRMPTVLSADPDGAVKKAFLRIAELFLSVEPADELAAMGEFLLLLGKLSGAEELQHDSVLALAQQYIKAHYAEELSVELLAQKCNVSASYLHKLFSEKLGQSPHDLLVNRRISAAKALLINSDLPLSEIAIDCGFNSQAYFSDCFRRKTGMTPGEFRKSAAYF
ncbi:MAG: helix-turn-helix transcriptional regulator [Clostridia bacterium]|nr:helix-turn-helix transcriptional regulator [Clostridia bacterium]